MNINKTLTADQDAAVAEAAARFNRETNVSLTPQEFLDHRVDDLLATFSRAHDERQAADVAAAFLAATPQRRQEVKDTLEGLR